MPLFSEPALLTGLGILLVYSAVAPWRDRQHVRRLRYGSDPNYREMIYRELHILLWSLASVVVVCWTISGRSLVSLGFSHEASAGLAIAWAVTLLIGGYAVASAIFALRSQKVRELLRRQFEAAGDLVLLQPQTARQHRRFYLISITASVTEEVVYRGFLIGVFSVAMPVALAAILGTSLFALAHAYQGWRGMARVVPIGGTLAAMFVLSGSLVPGIVLHFAIDACGGAMMYSASQAESPT